MVTPTRINSSQVSSSVSQVVAVPLLSAFWIVSAAVTGVLAPFVTSQILKAVRDGPVAPDIVISIIACFQAMVPVPLVFTVNLAIVLVPAAKRVEPRVSPVIDGIAL